MMAYDLGGNWQKELQRLELSKTLTTKQIWEVLPPYDPDQLVTLMYLTKPVTPKKISPPNSLQQNLAQLRSLAGKMVLAQITGQSVASLVILANLY